MMSDGMMHRSLTGTLRPLPQSACFLGHPTPCGEALGALFLPLKEAESKIKGRGSHGAGKDLGELGILEFCFPTQPGFQKVSNRGHLSHYSPSHDSIPAPPSSPTRPHLRRSSGGGTPRRRFTHC